MSKHEKRHTQASSTEYRLRVFARLLTQVFIPEVAAMQLSPDERRELVNTLNHTADKLLTASK